MSASEIKDYDKERLTFDPEGCEVPLNPHLNLYPVTRNRVVEETDIAVATPTSHFLVKLRSRPLPRGQKMSAVLALFSIWKSSLSVQR